MHQTIYDHLKRVAAARQLTTYGDVAPLARLDPNAYNFFRILEEISSYEHRHGRPMLTAVVVSKDDNIPGPGFFSLARKLGLHSGTTRDADVAFFVRELKRVHDFWSHRST